MTSAAQFDADTQVYNDSAFSQPLQEAKTSRKATLCVSGIILTTAG